MRLTKHARARPWIAAIDLAARWGPRARHRLAQVFGGLLWRLVPSRRRIALANLRACFPQHSAPWHERTGRTLVIRLARSLLDHGLLNQASMADLEALVKVDGAAHLMNAANRPLICIAPHFVGIDAGGIRFASLVRGVNLYSRAANPAWDAWMLKARSRFNAPLLLAKQGNDMRAVIRALRDGRPFYCAPDVDVGAQHSIFVPFFGVPAATVPMVSRLARLTGARVLMVVTEMTEDGYLMHIEPPWEDFPGASVEADTERVNQAIERWVAQMPDQYLWTHRRFKTRPPGFADLYTKPSRGRS